MRNRPIREADSVAIPPAWCGAICRNAMNELCVEHCAIKRDCSGFEPKLNLKLVDMPHFPMTEGMTKEEKFTSLMIYLTKVVDHLQGVEDDHNTFVIRRPSIDRFGSSALPENVKVEDLLSGLTKADTPFEVGEKREDSGI